MKKIIARGHTSKPGQHHAEAMALNQINAEGNGVTAFVTLEPCSFHGRTPSCAKALGAAGIAKVYVGMIDPHPKNCGKGIDILNAAGIEVEVGVMKESVEADLTPYLSNNQNEVSAELIDHYSVGINKTIVADSVGD